MSEETIQTRRDGVRPEGAQFEKLIHLALPVRLIHMPNGERGGLELACTYDIHPSGARLRSSRNLKVGDLVTVERGRCKVISGTPKPQAVCADSMSIAMIWRAPG